MKDRNRGVSAQLNSSNSSVTQPVGDGRNNSRRIEQIQTLHQEFQDLKKKIKDVQTKNEEIIQNIHKRYDFKKKPQTMQYVSNKPPIVYYQHVHDKTQLSAADNHSNHSNESECEFKIAKPIVKKTSNIKKNINPAHHQSMEYRKTQNNVQQRDPSEVSSHKTNQNQQRKTMTPVQPFGYGTGSHFRPQNMQQEQFQVSQFSGLSPYQMSMQFPSYPSIGVNQGESFYGGNSNIQFEETIRREREKVRILQKELQQKQNDTVSLRKLQKKYSNLANTFQQAIEQSMQEFMEGVVQKRMTEIQKYVRKNQNRLRKLHLMLKDREEESRSARNISQHRLKRSISRSKRDSSPRNNATFNSVPRVPVKKALASQPVSTLQVDVSSASKSKQSDQQSKSSVKFQQIAVQYQEMIKVKNKELQASQQRLRQKERELAETSAKCAKLELRLAETDQNSRKERSSKSLEKEENLLLSEQLDEERDGQIKLLSKKISQFEQNGKKKQSQLKQKETNIQRLNKKLGDFQIKTKKLEAEIKLFKDDKKRMQESKNKETQLQVRLKRMQSELSSKQKELSVVKERCVRIENEKIESGCEHMTLSNKIKKLESLLVVREEKLLELEKIIQSNNGVELPDLLERSMVVQKGEQNVIHNLQEEKQKLEDVITHKQEQIYTLQKNNQSLVGKYKQSLFQNEHLKKEIQTLLIQNQSMKINKKAMQFQKYSVKNDTRSPLQKLLQENECLSQHEDDHAREQLQQIRNKYQQIQRQLKIQKHQSLEYDTKIIKINSENSYYRELLTERQNKYDKLRKQYQESRCQVTQLTQALQVKQGELQQERRVNYSKMMELQTQIMQLQAMSKEPQFDDSHNVSELRNSRNFSEQSFVNYRNTFNNINAQNEHLVEKLKEAEKIIQIQKEMQDKIVSEYRDNVDKIKGQLRENIRKNEQLTEDIDNLRRKIRVMEQNESRLKEMANGGRQEQLLGISNEKIYQLELQLAEVKKINEQRADVQDELLKQIAEKQNQIQSLVASITKRQRKIEELKDIIELKEMNISSHISSSQHKSKVKDSQQSESSLRYSIISNNVNKDKTMELQLSQAGESFFQQNQSMISNISEVFEREEFPYEKMQLKRVEQRRLFQKTGAYIKSLKHAIDEKDKKIRLLQKKIESLRNSQLIRKDIYQIKQNLDFKHADKYSFKDYYTVQPQTYNYRRYRQKQLQHDAQLAFEENNIHKNEIASLQEQLYKSEQQENSLMKLKDLYKDEIKTLIKKNQEQAKSFEDEMKRQRQKIEQSQSVQRMQAIKQFFTKIMNAVILISTEGQKSKNREEGKRLLLDYTKVFCNFLNLEESVRQKILSDLRK